ncbi:hypothetical protein [Kitasatospora sp. NPDC008115]|uniref:hypothetical protein n=1 Tax=Kitasatospora sp. NPDC008115 TaxID=3364022 RepID=UPI0036EF8FB3
MIHDIDRLLEGAGSGPAARPRYDLEAGRRYIAERQAARRTASPSAPPPRVPAPAPSAPARPLIPVGMLIDGAARDLKAPCPRASSTSRRRARG